VLSSNDMNRGHFYLAHLCSTGGSVFAIAVRGTLLMLLGASTAMSQTVLEMPTSIPDPLTMAGGQQVTSVQQWPSRRTEMLHQLTEQMYGQMPPRPAKMRFRIYDNDSHALNGLATR
jgi:hypothetical protein